jgi:hypothetical protein
VVTTRHTSPVACPDPPRREPPKSTQKAPNSLAGTRGVVYRERRGSGVGLAAVVGGVALAGAALAGALAHICSKMTGDCQWPIRATIQTIVAYYLTGDDMEFVGGRPGRAAEPAQWAAQGVALHQINANRRKSTLSPVTRIWFSSARGREGHTQVMFWRYDAQPCHDQDASERNFATSRLASTGRPQRPKAKESS